MKLSAAVATDGCELNFPSLPIIRCSRLQGFAIFCSDFTVHLLQFDSKHHWCCFFESPGVLSFETEIRWCHECWGRTTKLGDEPIPVACVESTTRRRMGHQTRSVWDPWRSFKSTVLLCVATLGYNVTMKQSSTLYWFCCDSWLLYHALPSRVAPSSRVNWGYTHDRDYLAYKKAPKGRAGGRNRPWYPGYLLLPSRLLRKGCLFF